MCNYQKLIAEHIHDVLTIMPKEVFEHLCNGGFTISILGRAGHSIGIDEGHEMCINKDCKEFITRPSGDYIYRVARFLPIRSKAMKQFEQKQRKKSQSAILSIYHSGAAGKKLDANINKQVEKLSLSTVLSVEAKDDSLYIISLTKRGQLQNKPMIF